MYYRDHDNSKSPTSRMRENNSLKNDDIYGIEYRIYFDSE